jgi:NAD kinase
VKNFQNIYCIEKTTDFERVQKKELVESSLLNIRRKKNHENHEQFMAHFLKKIQTHFPKLQTIKDRDMKKIKPTKDDLVISCGGDGTFLACAQDYFDATLLGVNTNYLPQDPIFGSVGALTSINKENLDQKLEAFLKGAYTRKKWRRLAAKVGEKKIPHFAVNDIFVGPAFSYKTCYCSLKSPKHRSEFFCSGILSCTGVGSHSWYRNAGGTPFGRSLDNFAYLVLTPDIKSLLPEYSEILTGKESIDIFSLKAKILLVFDSRESITVGVNEKIKIFLDHKKPIKVIDF